MGAINNSINSHLCNGCSSKKGTSKRYKILMILYNNSKRHHKYLTINCSLVNAKVFHKVDMLLLYLSPILATPIGNFFFVLFTKAHLKHLKDYLPSFIIHCSKKFDCTSPASITNIKRSNN